MEMTFSCIKLRAWLYHICLTVNICKTFLYQVCTDKFILQEMFLATMGKIILIQHEYIWLQLIDPKMRIPTHSLRKRKRLSSCFSLHVPPCTDERVKAQLVQCIHTGMTRKKFMKSIIIVNREKGKEKKRIYRENCPCRNFYYSYQKWLILCLGHCVLLERNKVCFYGQDLFSWVKIFISIGKVSSLFQKKKWNNRKKGNTSD